MGEISSVSSKKKLTRFIFAEKNNQICCFQEYLGFIQTIGSAISGKRITDEKIVKSEPVVKLVAILDVLSSWIDEIKLAEQQQRFGNVAFREWHSRLLEVTIKTNFLWLIENDWKWLKIWLSIRFSFTFDKTDH